MNWDGNSDKRSKPSITNTTREEQDTTENRKLHAKIIMLPAKKGNVTAVMNNKQSKNKIERSHSSQACDKMDVRWTEERAN